MVMTAMAKEFKNGASQAVRLPREFQFDVKEVCIKRMGSLVLLFPRKAAWEIMENTLGKFTDDFMADREQPGKSDKRKPLERKKGKRK
jgi:antitoxin VapB